MARIASLFVFPAAAKLFPGAVAFSWSVSVFSLSEAYVYYVVPLGAIVRPFSHVWAVLDAHQKHKEPETIQPKPKEQAKPRCLPRRLRPPTMRWSLLPLRPPSPPPALLISLLPSPPPAAGPSPSTRRSTRSTCPPWSASCGPSSSCSRPRPPTSPSGPRSGGSRSRSPPGGSVSGASTARAAVLAPLREQ